MSVVLPDSYIIDIIGPYQGTLNDANITKEIIETNNSIVTWLGGEGHMIMNRGFMDVVQVFEDLGYETHLPAFLINGETQLSTEDIDIGRLSRKTRWVAETFDGRLKNWRLMDDRIHNSMIPKLKVRARTF